jgi:hypothetical protein
MNYEPELPLTPPDERDYDRDEREADLADFEIKSYKENFANSDY